MIRTPLTHPPDSELVCLCIVHLLCLSASEWLRLFILLEEKAQLMTSPTIIMESAFCSASMCLCAAQQRICNFYDGRHTTKRQGKMCE